VTDHISRAEWAQIESRVRKAQFAFDPAWKCLIDGKAYRQCDAHDEIDQDEIIAKVRERLNA